MFATIQGRIPRDGDLPARAATIDQLGRVLNGTIYDVLPYQFHEEKTGGGEYIPLRDRQPSVRYNLCRLVVEDSVSLLFGEGRFPVVDCEDKPTRDALADLIKAARLNLTMIDAAHRGSVGSAAIQMRVLSDRVFLDVFDTAYLTPEYDPNAPDTLRRVTEKRKVLGSALRDAGYVIKDDMLGTLHWFKRVWDANADTWFVPWPCSETEHFPQTDAARTVTHVLGFVPMVWIRNLPGGSGIDGPCTFRPAIETAIEIDYQLSQAGRGLKYSSDPTLLIKEPAAESGTLTGGAASAIIVSEKGDAKLLEINGTASAAVIEYVRTLRELALESVHGNRSNADKVSAAQSGRALELMHQPLIWLADNLRITYGEDGLLRLCNMLVAASRKVTIKVNGVPFKPSDKPLKLIWPRWFAPTEQDKNQDAQALATHRTAGHLSQESAVKSIAPDYDVEDVSAEIARILADEAAADARALAQTAAQTKITETTPG